MASSEVLDCGVENKLNFYIRRGQSDVEAEPVFPPKKKKHEYR